MKFRKEKQKRNELNYQIVLEDWKKRMTGKVPNKPKRGCPLRTTSISKIISKLEEEVNYITEHPFDIHWHYPELIRKEDFLVFYEENKNVQIGEKIRYFYEGKRE